MKGLKKLSILFACAVLAFAGCAEGPCLKLENLSSPVDFHTGLQASYLADDYKAVSAYAAGAEELSLPEAVTLRWTDSSGSSEYVVEISENQDFSECERYAATQTSLEVYNLKIATQYFWRVSEGDVLSSVGSFTTSDVAPRNLYVEGVTNVRDLGGWTTPEGRVAQGLIYRGGRLNKSDVNDDGYATAPKEFVPEITPDGAETFRNQLKIKTEIDLRLTTRNGYPADKPLVSTVEGVNYYSIPMNGSASIIDSEVNAAALKRIMELLCDRTVYPVYIHCNIGTDRMGLVSYLLNALCGVEKEDLMRDYLFSNFGNIGEAKEPENSKNTYVGMLDNPDLYAGDTLRERVESYFRSIGVSEQTYSAVRDIMTGR